MRMPQLKIIHLQTSITRRRASTNKHIHIYVDIYTGLNAFENVISAEMIEFDVSRSGDFFDEAGGQEELQ